DAVDRSRIVVIQPGGKHTHPAQLAAPLVWIDVVGVVRPGAGVSVLADNFTGYVPARQRANRAIRGSRRVVEPSADIVHVNRPLLAGVSSDRGARRDIQVR